MQHDEILSPQEDQEAPTLSDLPGSNNIVRHAGNTPENEGGERSSQDPSDETPTLRGLVAQNGAPVPPPGSPAGIFESETSTPTRERPLVFSRYWRGLFNTRRKKIIAGGAAATTAVLLTGSIAALHSKNEESPEPLAVEATQPTAAPSSAPTPSETVSPTPTDIPAVPVAPAPSEISSIASGEFGTDVSVPASLFPELISESRILQLESENPELSSMIAEDFMLRSALQLEVTTEKIYSYQAAFKKAYADPDVRNVLGSPQGMMSAEQSLQNTDKAKVASLIPLTAAKFVENIARGVKDNKPGATSSLAELTSLNPESINWAREQIDSGVVDYAQATSTDILAFRGYRTIDNNPLVLLAAFITYDNTHKALGLYTLVTVDSQKSFIAVPFFIHNFS